MDLHIVPGVVAKDVAQVHMMDVQVEKEYNCKCLTYWFDESRGHAFCLIDAPDKESVVELHSRSHGLVPHKVIEVESNLVHAFLGRITDPENAQLTETGLKILDDTSYRIIMNVQMADAILLEHTCGKSDAQEHIYRFQTVIREELLKNNGREVNREGNEMVASFESSEKAFVAACAIKEQLSKVSEMELRISIHAGEPVMQTDKLFGDTVQMLRRMNFAKNERVIHITAAVKELLSKSHFSANSKDAFLYAPQDETFLTLLFDTLDKKYSEEDFNVEDCGDEMAMSKSQLYRKTTALCGLSPNNLLKEYRLKKARSLMRRKDATISEVAFDTGFASPSYFTKCFKSRFGVLPMNYMELALR
jgi:AraC-like DNA-binding protein